MKAPILWHGVTYLEEHEIAPTYEVYLAGCPLRCPFCYVDAMELTKEPMSPEELLSCVTLPDVPPFRALSLLGGEPTLHMPFLQAFVPLARKTLPGIQLVVNTSFSFHEEKCRDLAGSFDWVVGCVHAATPTCAIRIGAPPTYADLARRNVRTLLELGTRVILRLLVLPGHLSCCLEPLLAWADRLSPRESLRVHVMTHYAPLGRARGMPGLNRHLTPEETVAALAMIPPGLPLVVPGPLPGFPKRTAHARDAGAFLEVDAEGRIFLPFVTGTLLALAAREAPLLRSRLVYLDLRFR